MTTTVMTRRLRASDVSGQKRAIVSDCPTDCTIDELVQSLLTEMHMPANDTEGRPVSYEARLDRQGRSLLGAELVGDAIQDDDEVVLQPNVDAGRQR